MRAHINIGSNTGDRHGYLQLAVAALSVLARQGSHDPAFRCSSVVESPPWGYDSTKAYLNCAVSFETTIGPEQLLDHLQRIEREISPTPHRDAGGNYIDRAIDIDLILLGDTRVSTPRLTLPHPRAHLRPFVILPLREIDPDLLHLLIRT